MIMRGEAYRSGLAGKLFRSCAALALMMTGSVAGAQSSAPMPDMPGMSAPHFPQTIADWAHGAQLFDGLGDFHRPVSTRSPEAQQYFDQGMRLLWAFNHDEAARSFARAAEIDPHCAICFWGVALTLGPNYNMPLMAAARARVAWDAVLRARAEAATATATERALIDAIGQRYRGPTALDPSNTAPLLAAYAGAMRDAAHLFPDDADVQTLFAEAVMNITPWKLWNADGSPAPGTMEVVATLEKVLAKHPDHPGANHYYIHAVEASPHPEAALASAERLKAMMPAAGHLVHMPSHILQRVGRYEEAAQANRLGAAADAGYYGRTAPIDYYPMYTAHNDQFLAFSAAMEGRRAETLNAARAARGALTDDMLAAMGSVDWSIGYLYDAMVRFGLWDEMLREPLPDHRLVGLTVSYLSARAISLAARGRIAEADEAAAALDTVAATSPAGAVAGLNAARDVFAVASLKTHARILAAKGDRDGAIRLLTRAVAAEDRLSYDEPADIFFPTRHMLGAALLEAGRTGEAEAVYREDLIRNPDNGWALLGLAKALAAEGRGGEARGAMARYRAAWVHADMVPVSSAF
jgi:tetratricopeptide (TPR) repeat protein